VRSAISADHVTRRQVLHFKPAAGAFNDFLLGFQHVGFATGAFNRFMTKG
jgi:hypothetical protein